MLFAVFMILPMQKNIAARNPIVVATRVRANCSVIFLSRRWLPSKPNGEITCRPRDSQILERGYFRSGLLTCWVLTLDAARRKGEKFPPKSDQASKNTELKKTGTYRQDLQKLTGWVVLFLLVSSDEHFYFNC